ncbi:uncharacterized protein EURHEDRAFT_416586 [Aspergillus ruber CBS 135680]|uniref:Uncharacterized protein n=1 Tax=Aspergillus ruber (strain CBS 135680) TaxID=1388766 RepID=A0A017S584_ASPRC|nr:uncharacterized protein EURHEDRAFT_416586 [Aspergillus ruber CBS 135680]EYE91340.1 hypothetical protein EURHEDRAFT_416586 [Aspergillus ruber CBS 135680]
MSSVMDNQMVRLASDGQSHGSSILALAVLPGAGLASFGVGDYVLEELSPQICSSTMRPKLERVPSFTQWKRWL